MVIRSCLAYSTYLLGFVFRKIRQNRGSSLIVTYHRVLPKTEADETVQAGMYVDPSAFASHLVFLKKHFVLRPLSAVMENSVVSKASQPRPDCFLTFDDGWRDFYTHAFPILKAHNAPATVFLPTDYIGTDKRFWTDRLAHLLSKRNGNEPVNRSSEQRTVNSIEKLKGRLNARLEAAVEMLKPRRNEEIEGILQELAARWDVESETGGRVFLTWEEVREMAASGLVTYGSHSASHRILTTLADSDVEQELSVSREKLLSEGVAKPEFIPFCYPNGDYNETILRLTRNTGYSLAVTTDKGWVNSKSDKFRLARIGLHQDISASDALLGYRITETV